MVQKNTHIQVATAGEALIDRIGHADGRFEPCIGGAVYNLSRALARQSIETLYLNPLSRDRFGRLLAAGHSGRSGTSLDVRLAGKLHQPDQPTRLHRRIRHDA